MSHRDWALENTGYGKGRKPKKKAVPRINKPAGRPPVYDPERHPQLVFDLCLLGLPDVKIADAVGVLPEALREWRSKYSELGTAYDRGRSQANGRVARSLYEKAVGYEHRVEKPLLVAGQVEIVEYTERLPPDTTAAQFFLKNRTRPEFEGRWTDKTETELSGPDGEPLAVPPIILNVVTPPERGED